MMPRLLDFDEKSALLVMEDLFAAEPLIDCYQGSRQFDQRQLNELAKYASALHSLVVPANEREAFGNTAMRRLNHEHIFDLPLRHDGALSEMLERITPGLDRVADDLRQDRKYSDIVRSLGDRYLREDGPSLIHGDLFPGSLLQTTSGELRIIDPEFCFCGDPEFDIGVFYAHLLLSGHGEDALTWWLQDALKRHEYSDSLVFQYAGVEIMRHSRRGSTASSRLIGGKAPLAGTKPRDGSPGRPSHRLSRFCFWIWEEGYDFRAFSSPHDGWVGVRWLCFSGVVRRPISV